MKPPKQKKKYRCPSCGVARAIESICLLCKLIICKT